MTIRKGAGISDHAWLAELPENNLESFEVRHRLISKLASLNKPTRASICAIASDLGVSDRWVRKLLARYQESDGDALSVLPGKRGAPVGRTRQPKTTEEVVLQVLERAICQQAKTLPEVRPQRDL